MWFFSQHQRLGHHIDSSDNDSCNTNETSFRHSAEEYHLDLSKPFDWTRTALNTNAGAQGLKLLRDLKCQLPGGGEDEGVKPLGWGQQWLEDRQSKGTRLSWTSLCQADNILACSSRRRHKKTLVKFVFSFLYLFTDQLFFCLFWHFTDQKANQIITKVPDTAYFLFTHLFSRYCKGFACWLRI